MCFASGIPVAFSDTSHVTKKDLLPIQQVLKKMNDDAKKEQSEKDLMLWVAPLIVGVLSAGAGYFGIERSRKSNERNIRRQFVANLGARNMQEWMNELRIDLSEFISCCSVVAMEMGMKGSETDTKNLKKAFSRFSFHRAKICMLLDPGDEEGEQQNLEREVLRLVDSLVNMSFQTKSNFDATKYEETELALREASSDLFGKYWKQIQGALPGD